MINILQFPITLDPTCKSSIVAELSSSVFCGLFYLLRSLASELSSQDYPRFRPTALMGTGYSTKLVQAQPLAFKPRLVPDPPLLRAILYLGSTLYPIFYLSLVKLNPSRTTAKLG